MNSPGAAAALPSHLFAWDGFAFEVPLDWNLSFYDFTPKFSSVRMEDDISIRLQAEWCRPSNPVAMDRIQDRYHKMAQQVERLATQKKEIPDLPPGWSAHVYRMPDDRQLATCFWLGSDGRFFIFFRLHIEQSGSGYARAVIALLTRTFRLTGPGLRPWSVYDMGFELDSGFALQRTTFEAGRKLMVFEWRLRQLYIWRFSLADHVLQGRELAAWSVDFLNRYKGIRGPQFLVAGDGNIGVRKRTRYPLGHYDEISRMCFRYRAGCRLLPEENAMVLTVFNYRKASDLVKFNSLRLLSLPAG